MADSKNNLPSNQQWATRGWFEKFRNATRGVVWGTKGQSSFIIHTFAALVVVVGGVITGLGVERWCLLIICIGAVLAAEMFNSALESICRSITSLFDPQIQRALDIASGAVLIVAITAAIAGVLIFVEAAVNFGNRTG